MQARTRWLTLSEAAALVALLGVGDWVTGTELRLLPLYFGPVSLAAWRLGRKGAFLVALLATFVWFAANAGPWLSRPALLVTNLLLQGAAFAFVGVLIAELRSASVRDRESARTDALTDLMNRRAFFDEAAVVLARARRSGRPLTVAYVDLDHFKQVNDTHGHAVGDEVLRRVASVLRANLRLGDVVARLGGDEFAVLLPDTALAGAGVLLERLRASVADAARDLGVTTSIGAVSFAAAPADVEVLVRCADAAMYDAKMRGRNRITLEEL